MGAVIPLSLPVFPFSHPLSLCKKNLFESFVARKDKLIKITYLWIRKDCELPFREYLSSRSRLRLTCPLCDTNNSEALSCRWCIWASETGHRACRCGCVVISSAKANWYLLHCLPSPACVSAFDCWSPIRYSMMKRTPDENKTIAAGTRTKTMS